MQRWDRPISEHGKVEFDSSAGHFLRFWKSHPLQGWHLLRSKLLLIRDTLVAGQAFGSVYVSDVVHSPACLMLAKRRMVDGYQWFGKSLLCLGAHFIGGLGEVVLHLG